MEEYNLDGSCLEAKIYSESHILDKIKDKVTISMSKIYYIIKLKIKSLKDDWIYELQALGRDGSSIKVLKIKTMYEGIHNFGYVDKNGKSMNGHRIIPGRRWLREKHYDEILNIIGYLDGKLKLVGIRPRPEEWWDKHYTQEERDFLLSQKPGINNVALAYPEENFKKVELRYQRRAKEEPGLAEIEHFAMTWYNKFFNGHRSH